MAPRLQVLVGPDRFHMEPARLNDTRRPHEIDTEHFVGRVLVRVKDAPGAREGDDGREYFRDRSRRFCIQLEGRFKKPWNGNEVLFGTDFEYLPKEFPRSAFNAGMRVAKMIDPCTFYEEKPPSGRPYIMSAYAACMNTLCAWPAPSRANDAVIVLRHPSGDSSGAQTPSSPRTDDDDDDDVVPQESLAESAGKEAPKKRGWFGMGGAPKEQRVRKKYWSFIGFADEVPVRALLEAHHAHLNPSRPRSPAISGIQRTGTAASTSSNASSIAPPPGAGEVQQGHDATHPTISRLGTFTRSAAHKVKSKLRDGSEDDRELEHEHGSTTPTMGTVRLPTEDEAKELDEEHRTKEEAPEMPPLQRITTDARRDAEAAAATDGLHESDFDLAGERLARQTSVRRSASGDDGTAQWHSKLDDQLGPWRWADPRTDMVEENAFVFTNKSVSTARRRKHFASEEARKSLVYSPDVVYGASFFTDAFDFNTFNLGLGPVSLNIKRFFQDMPVRYTLRAADAEETTFCTVSFQLVDE